MAKVRFENQKITRRGLLRAGVRCGVGLGSLGASGTVWGGVEVDWVEVNPVEVKMPRLPQAFDGFRIAQISDVHIEGGAMRRQFPDIARLTTAQKADAIVLTGDYTTYGDHWQEEPLVAGFKELKAPYGVFAVLGNHDQWFLMDGSKNGAEVARSALRRGGIRELNNEALAIEREGQKLWMCGIDDALYEMDDIRPIKAALPPGACAILLAHEPDLADAVASMNLVDLMLSGHSHGGQIAVPFVGPVHVPGGAKKYPRGRYQVGDMVLYTNRGLGTVDIPLRFCARPEITVFTLRC